MSQSERCILAMTTTMLTMTMMWCWSTWWSRWYWSLWYCSLWLMKWSCCSGSNMSLLPPPARPLSLLQQLPQPRLLSFSKPLSSFLEHHTGSPDDKPVSDLRANWVQFAADIMHGAVSASPPQGKGSCSLVISPPTSLTDRVSLSALPDSQCGEYYDYV